MLNEEAGLGFNDYEERRKKRAIRAFARYGISLNPQQLEADCFSRLMATLDFRETKSGNQGLISVTFDGLEGEEVDSLEAFRDISHKSGMSGAAITCFAIIDKGEVKDYKLHFATNKVGYMIELNPEGR